MDPVFAGLLKIIGNYWPAILYALYRLYKLHKWEKEEQA